MARKLPTNILSRPAFLPSRRAASAALAAASETACRFDMLLLSFFVFPRLDVESQGEFKRFPRANVDLFGSIVLSSGAVSWLWSDGPSRRWNCSQFGEPSADFPLPVSLDWLPLRRLSNWSLLLLYFSDVLSLSFPAVFDFSPFALNVWSTLLSLTCCCSKVLSAKLLCNLVEQDIHH